MKKLALFSLLAGVATLATLGVVMLASTSYFSDETGGESYRALRQQGIWLILSLILCGTASFVDFNHLHRLRWWIFGIAIAGLLLCYVPGIGESVNGARRWVSLKSIGLGVLRFQPSEFAKLACAIVLAGWFTRQEPHTREFIYGFVIPGALVVAFVASIALEIDLGSAVLVSLLGGAMMFVAGVRLIYLIPVVACGGGALVLAVKLIPNRTTRIMAFLDLEKYRESFGLQQWRAMLSFGSGGPQGLGLGNGRQKMLFLPEAHTDFIFPMIGEELGLVGSISVVLMFLLLTAGGMWIAAHAPNRFGRLLAFGITLMFAMEALLNMGVTTALLPNKGLPLPFVSYGGSSLVAAMIGVGILINIHRQSVYASNPDLLTVRRHRMTAVA
jgi:cell division protein FtsW